MIIIYLGEILSRNFILLNPECMKLMHTHSLHNFFSFFPRSRNLSRSSDKHGSTRLPPLPMPNFPKFNQSHYQPDKMTYDQLANFRYELHRGLFTIVLNKFPHHAIIQIIDQNKPPFPASHPPSPPYLNGMRPVGGLSINQSIHHPSLASDPGCSKDG